MKAHGATLEVETLANFDRGLDQALALAAGGALHEEALKQDSLGVKQGGRGARKAADVVLPAFVA